MRWWRECVQRQVRSRLRRRDLANPPHNHQTKDGNMAMLRLRVSDISGSRVHEVEAPGDVAVNRILVVLIERMNLPLNSPDGQLMSYKLHHRRTGTQLLDSQTLAEAGVVEGDELRLQPEITAGSRGHGVHC